ncbi:MAG: antibiotic biosynthesis monooxygenase [Steroidobacteraceae bacterium]
MTVLDVVASLNIAPGKFAEFTQAAAEALQICRTKDTGTLAYEWFVNDAQTECFVLESYAGAEGLLAHVGNAQPVGSKIMQAVSATSVNGYGEATPELVQALQGAIKFMPRLQGLPNAVRRASDQPSTTIRAVARFKIQPGQGDEFKRYAAECLQAAVSLDHGTLAYEWFMSQDGSECVVLEAYKDGSALLEHSKNGGRHVGKLLKLSEVSLNMFADPIPEVLAVLKAMPVKLFKRLQGLGN